ncbi:MAG: PaaI family thioesterase [Myxococcota bacterium]
MSEAPDALEQRRRAWLDAEPGRLVARGHPAGDFLEAYQWKLLERREGYVRIDAHLPEHVKNPRGQLFGGFTPTYVDFVALFTIHGGRPAGPARVHWLATTNMRVDYFEPVLGPRFEIESELIHQRKRTCLVETRFRDAEGRLLVFALTTIRKIQLERELGDA